MIRAPYLVTLLWTSWSGLGGTALAAMDCAYEQVNGKPRVELKFDTGADGTNSAKLPSEVLDCDGIQSHPYCEAMVFCGIKMPGGEQRIVRSIVECPATQIGKDWQCPKDPSNCLMNSALPGNVADAPALTGSAIRGQAKAKASWCIVPDKGILDPACLQKTATECHEKHKEFGSACDLGILDERQQIESGTQQGQPSAPAQTAPPSLNSVQSFMIQCKGGCARYGHLTDGESQCVSACDKQCRQSFSDADCSAGDVRARGLELGN